MNHTFKFTRLTSAGNTFLFCSLNDQPFELAERGELAVRLCNEFVGFRTDGMVFVEKLGSNKAKWDFYNGDGSPAEMCGNAARAVACYYQANEPLVLDTRIGKVTVKSVDLANGLYSATWVIPGEAKWENDFQMNGQTSMSFDYVDSGVPHAILEMEPFPELAKELRQFKGLSKNGMNVTFVEQTSPGEVTAVTFERGVEDFTLACGTGAVAAAIWSKELNPELNIHEIKMPGGLLTVTLKEANLVELTGPSQIDFVMEVEL